MAIAVTVPLLAGVNCAQKVPSWRQKVCDVNVPCRLFLSNRMLKRTLCCDGLKSYIEISVLGDPMSGNITLQNYRIFSNLIRTSFCRFLKRKKNE